MEAEDQLQQVTTTRRGLSAVARINEGPFKDLLPLLSSEVPRCIPSHASFLKLPEVILMVAIRQQGQAQRLKQPLGAAVGVSLRKEIKIKVIRLTKSGLLGFITTYPSSALLGPGVKINDRILQTTSLVGHRHCAIPHGIKLIQATWLKPRGHY